MTLRRLAFKARSGTACGCDFFQFDVLASRRYESCKPSSGHENRKGEPTADKLGDAEVARIRMLQSIEPLRDWAGRRRNTSRRLSVLFDQDRSRRHWTDLATPCRIPRMNKSRAAIPRSGRIIAFAIAIMLSASSIAKAASAYLVLDAKSGRILAASHGDVHHYPASLTKMMTLYLAFEALHHGRLTWHTRIPFSRHAASRPPTKLSVKPGAWITLRQAVLGMIVRSANDAAVAVAEKLGRTEARFARMMTARAHALGMSRTLFTNASGLPDRRQVTTARDMSTLAVALINHFPREYRLFSVPSFKFRGHLIRGHNHLMYRYKGMDGIKTGYTHASGFNLVSAVRAGYRRVIGVVLGGGTAKSRDAKMAALLDRYLPKASARKAKTLIASVGPGLAPRKRASRPALHEKSIPDQVEAAATAPSSQWQIQLAATSDRSAAIALLNRARVLLDGGLADLTPHTEPVASASDTLYRARFAGFATRQRASDACETLTAHELECVAIPPHR